MNGVLFQKSELEELRLDHLQNVAKYLEIEFTSKTSKAKLIQLILAHQEKASPSASVSETPRYSVRVQRIMEMKSKGQL